jgi:hypothetical protein
MSAGQNGVNPSAYRPTSLDFINRPNPVEPHAVPEKHPLNNTQRLEKNAHPEFLRLLIDQSGSLNVDRPAKRRKSGEAKLLDLPKLPAVRNGTKRLRIPPTLSGLHQPPPNAGLLPSISVDQPINLPNRALPHEAKSAPQPEPSSSDPVAKAKPQEVPKPSQKATGTKPKRNKWSHDETADLLKGVARFGIGNWTQILNCPDYHFVGRTAIDLKDRFRVCCPNDYKVAKKPMKGEPEESQEKDADTTRVKASRPNRSDRKSSSELLRLGIKEPFERSKRRRRTDYTAKEDEAILLGFKKYGNSWSAIRQDPALGLIHRRATDLRDRFRTKYPEQYEKAGLAPRRDVGPKKGSNDGKESSTMRESDGAAASTNEKSTTSNLEKTSAEANQPDKENKTPNTTLPPMRQPTTSLLHYDSDVFWGAPFDVEDAETERITLDRRILDWPSEISKPSTSRNDMETFSLFKNATNSSQNPSGTNKSSVGAALPSLAAITAGSDDFAEHLELPSLMGAFAALDGDGRTGGHFPSIDELWK